MRQARDVSRVVSDVPRLSTHSSHRCCHCHHAAGDSRRSPVDPPAHRGGAVRIWFPPLSSHLLTPLPQVEVEGGSLNFPALLNTINSCREWQNLTRAGALVFGRKTERWPQGIKYCVPRSPRPGAAASEQATVPSVRSLKWAQRLSPRGSWATGAGWEGTTC